MTNNWDISHPALKAVAYAAPFIYILTTYTALIDPSEYTLVTFALYAFCTYHAVLTALQVRDEQELGGVWRKVVFVFSCFLSIAFVLALLFAITSTFLNV